MQDCKVNILGTEYQVMFRKEKDDPRLKDSDGYIDFSIKEIIVGIFKKTRTTIKDLESYQKKVLRHEIIHGFLYESGLWNNSDHSEAWACNEEMTDFFAIQSPKIFKVFQELELL